jgi:hypothetical protein
MGSGVSSEGYMSGLRNCLSSSPRFVLSSIYVTYPDKGAHIFSKYYLTRVQYSVKAYTGQRYSKQSKI